MQIRQKENNVKKRTNKKINLKKPLNNYEEIKK